MSFFSRPSSSAVKIVAPPTSHSEPASPRQGKKADTTHRQCRNILIYGSCKFQDKGCIYYHPPPEAANFAPPDSPTPSAALPAQAVNAPVFVPKNPSSPTPAPATPNLEHILVGAPSIASDPGTTTQDEGAYYESNLQPPAAEDPHMQHLAEQFQALDPSMNPYDQQVENGHHMDYDPAMDAAMDAFYSAHSSYSRQPPNYHLYTQPRPESLQLRYFISDTEREELQKRSEAVYAGPTPGLNLPEEIQGYHSLVPLEALTDNRRKFGNWLCATYKAVNSTDGATYVLRRVENFRLGNQSAFLHIEPWSKIKHPAVVNVKEAFTTRAFNDNSLVLVYDYHPTAQTIWELHFKSRPAAQNRSTRLPERTIWSYITQIASAIKTIHDAGLSARVIDVSKILVTSRNRLRLSSCGIIDIILHDVRTDVGMVQQDDLSMFGRLVLTLCTGVISPTNNLAKTMDTITRNYSQDLKNVALFLISKPSPLKGIRQLFDMMRAQVITEMDEALSATDRLESELMSELENGRLVRLLSKFGFIDERPEFARDPRWSETGDRYIIKLFRDYVFHQVDEQGRPVINLSHVLTCLNKLDAGVDERIMLVSRDEQSCLVVSYRDIKACMESAFNELSIGQPR